ncbi:MAG: tetratricopeptide repeat protein [Pseudomonadota bacterium]
MLTDRYDNRISTTSEAAKEAYIRGVDEFLAAGPGGETAFREALDADEGFALAHIALARQLQMLARGPEALQAVGRARALTGGVTEREAAHIHVLGLLIEGKGGEAYPLIRAHCAAFPRDVMVVQTCIGVFGLIGFSGQPGREAEQLAFTSTLLPHFGDDWWFLGGHAFAQVEAGQVAKAAETVERSLAQHPRNANSAHYKAHIHYEAGESMAGLAYMADWRRDYAKESLLHCHVSWHEALWALEQGDVDRMWEVVDTDVLPEAAWGPPINVISDSASILYRAELAGLEVPKERWQAVSAYASKAMPNTGIAFADVHAALAHAMAGNTEALSKVIAEAKGPAGDLVSTLGEAFGAVAREAWAEATGHFASTLSDHARIGGSRAQRDLIEFGLLACLLKQGRSEQAEFLLTTRRPVWAERPAVAGL